MQIQTDHRPLGVHARPSAALFTELIADRILDSAGRILRMRDRRVAHIGVDGQGVFLSHELRPIGVENELVQFIR